MDFFENIDALLWRLAAILALVLVATLVVRLLLRDRGRSDRQQKLRVQQTLKGSGRQIRRPMALPSDCWAGRRSICPVTVRDTSPSSAAAGKGKPLPC